MLVPKAALYPLLAVLVVTAGCSSAPPGSSAGPSSDADATLTSFDTVVVGCDDSRYEENGNGITNLDAEDGRELVINETFIADSRNASLSASIEADDDGFTLAVTNDAEANDSCPAEVTYSAVVRVSGTENPSLQVAHDGRVVTTLNSTENGSSASGGDVATRSE